LVNKKTVENGGLFILAASPFILIFFAVKTKAFAEVEMLEILCG
jgi:hypothetical protein